jgi:hypothetical protein
MLFADCCLLSRIISVGEKPMESRGRLNTSIRERLTSELREFVVIAIYLYIYFTALAYLKASILKAEGIAFAPFAFAAIKALICAKFILVGRMVHIGERLKTLPLIWPTLYKSFTFLVLLLLLNAIEEVIVGVFHHRSIVDSLASIGGGTLGQLIATSFIGVLVLMPFFAFRSLGEVVGERNLVRIFFTHRPDASA